MKERKMFYGAKADIFLNAARLRRNQTTSEKVLWEKLRKNQVNGHRFKRQHPIAYFVADFYCHNAKLVIELDGKYHDRTQRQLYDEERTRILNEFGLKILRFTDQQVFEDVEKVLSEIRKYLPSR